MKKLPEKASRPVRTVAVIQARMGSSRVPGKVMAPLLGKPMVWRIVERLRFCPAIDSVMISTSDQDSDDVLVEFCKREGIPFSRAPVDDLVSRLHACLEYSGAKQLVRIWGDCPCVDPNIIGKVVETFSALKLDYLGSNGRQRPFPGGLDFGVFSHRLLQHLHLTLDDPFLREFPADALVHLPQEFSIDTHDAPMDLDTQLHIMVDYPEDLELVRTIYASLYRKEKMFSFAEAQKKANELSQLSKATRDLPRNMEYEAKKVIQP